MYNLFIWLLDAGSERKTCHCSRSCWDVSYQPWELRAVHYKLIHMKAEWLRKEKKECMLCADNISKNKFEHNAAKKLGTMQEAVKNKCLVPVFVK